MKGFIEVTKSYGDKILISVNQINMVYPQDKESGSATLGAGVGTWIGLPFRDDDVLCQETYDEVKALIAEAQGEDIEPKRMSKEEGMQATFKVLRDIKENCAERWGCEGCEFRAGISCTLQKNPACWTV